MTKIKINSFLYIFLLLTSAHTFAQCVEDSHSSFKNHGWTSCKTSESANQERGKSHWIQYDLGSEYQLSDIRIWNHNVRGETGQGVKSVVLDYSINGSNWASVGILEIEKAPGSWKYVAPDPINLNGLVARYVLLTVLDTWEPNSACAGIAEVTFGVEATTNTNDITTQLNDFKIYPNPASEKITLECKDEKSKDIRIVNAVGQVVRRLGSVKKASIDVSITDLEDGLYYVKIESQYKTQTHSFSKIKN